MADLNTKEKNDDNNNTSGWGAWFSSGLKKAASVVTEDLAEFRTQVATDTEHFVAEQKRILEEKRDKERQSNAQSGKSGQDLHGSVDASIFAPIGPEIKDDFDRWFALSGFGREFGSLLNNDVQHSGDSTPGLVAMASDFKEQAAHLLSSSHAVQQFHSRLVGMRSDGKIADSEFWERYFFRRHQQREAEQRRDALLELLETDEEEALPDFDDHSPLPQSSLMPDTPSIPAVSQQQKEKNQDVAAKNQTHAAASLAPSMPVASTQVLHEADGSSTAPLETARPSADSSSSLEAHNTETAATYREDAASAVPATTTDESSDAPSVAETDAFLQDMSAQDSVTQLSGGTSKFAVSTAATSTSSGGATAVAAVESSPSLLTLEEDEDWANWE